MGMRPPLGLVKYAEFTKEPAVLKWWFAHCSRQEVEAIQGALRFMLGVREGVPGTATQKVPGIPGPVPMPSEPWGAHA